MKVANMTAAAMSQGFALAFQSLPEACPLSLGESLGMLSLCALHHGQQ